LRECVIEGCGAFLADPLSAVQLGLHAWRPSAEYALLPAHVIACGTSTIIVNIVERRSVSHSFTFCSRI
jgi:hypothetical protein